MLDLPRAPLADLPTPLDDAPRLSAALGGPRILIKRDDLSGLCCGGNKSRLLEWVMGDALAQGVDAVVAAASAQSNKLREIAAAANRLGMRAVLLIEDEAPASAPQGNLLLMTLLGAELRFLGPRPQDLPAQQQAVAAELVGEGHRVAVLDRHLRYGALATVAYVDAAGELAAQLARRGYGAGRVFVTAGAGMTMAGLALGLKHRGDGARVVGVTISRPVAEVVGDVVEHAGRAAALLGLDTRLRAADFDVLGGHVGPGYGVPTAEGVAAIGLVARHHGLVLDPIYSAKCMAGLIDQIRRGAIRPEETVVYVATGGGPGLFAYTDQVIELRA